MDEFELVIKKLPNDYWLSLKHIKSETAMNMHLDYEDIVKIRDHLETLIKERETAH